MNCPEVTGPNDLLLASKQTHAASLCGAQVIRGEGGGGVGGEGWGRTRPQWELAERAEDLGSLQPSRAVCYFVLDLCDLAVKSPYYFC